MNYITTNIRALTSHPLIKSIAIMFGGTMVANVLAYVYHLIVGRVLGPVQYGELAALLSIFYILNAPSTILQNIMVKFFSQLKAKGDHGQARQLFVVIMRYLGIFSIISFIVLIPFTYMFATFLHIEQPIYLIWLFFTFVTFLFSIVSISVLQAFQQFMAMAVVTNLSGMFRLIFGTVGAFFGVGWTLIGGIASNLTGFVMAFVPLAFLLKQKNKPLTISAGHALYYSVPTFIAVFSMTALYSQDVILVKHFFSAESAGIYSSLSVLGKIIFFASSAIGTVAFPILAERRETGKRYDKIIFLSLIGVGAMSFGLTLGYFMFPEIVVNLLFGKAFLSASMHLGPFGLFISFYTLANLFTTMYLAIGKTKVWIFASIAALLQTVVMNLYHGDLNIVIRNNTVIVAALFILLLLYYPYAKRKS